MKSVVLVEDSMLIATQLLERLSCLQPPVKVLGHAVSEDGAVQLILDKQPDAVILDMRLESGSGLGVIRRIRYQGCQARVLVLTNYTHPQMRATCHEAGVSGFFDKYIEVDECLQALEQV